VADTERLEVFHLDAHGVEIWRGRFAYPQALSVNPADGSCWVADSGSRHVVHLGADGTELWRGEMITDSVNCISVDPRDGSCWVTESEHGRVIHLAEDGTELWRGERFDLPEGVAVNSHDGSCWIGGGYGEVVYLGRDGTELWAGVGFSGSYAISANPADGSCWVADMGNAQVVRLAVVGYEGPPFPDVLAYHWACGEIEACHYADIAGGYLDGLYHPASAVTRDQMAVYVSRALAGGNENVPDGPSQATFDDVPADHWAYDYVEYAFASNVVQGYDPATYAPDVTVTRDQMAVYIARALVAPTGEAALADYVPADPRNFPDVPDTSWAYLHVEYCVENGVVQGYPDGFYQPANIVTRGQMAVFVARAFELPT
jgi:hypothetical protein